MDRDDGIESFRFAVILGSAFAVTAGFFAWQGASRAAALLSLAGGVVLGAAALNPEAIRPLERVWQAGGRILAAIREWAASGILMALKAIPRGVSGRREGAGKAR